MVGTKTALRRQEKLEEEEYERTMTKEVEEVVWYWLSHCGLPWPQNEIMRTVLFRSVQSVFGVGGLGLVGCRSIFQSLAGENRGSTINDQRFLSFDLLSSSAHVHSQFVVVLLSLSREIAGLLSLF